MSAGRLDSEHRKDLLRWRAIQLGIEASTRHDARVAKARIIVMIDDAVLRTVKVLAARLGKRDNEVIEEALRRDLGLELLDQLWARNDLSEAEAVELAVEAQLASRHRKS